MPQPAANDRIAAELIRLYAEAHDRLIEQLARVVAGDPARWREAARLREMIRSIDPIIDGLRDASRDWLTTNLPALHAAGATDAAASIGSAFTWTQPHLDAVQALATQAWGDIAANLQHIGAATKRALRDLSRQAAREALLEGVTAGQAGRGLAEAAARAGIGSVTYANGAKHTLADWADTNVRTVTAQAYNNGTFTQCQEDGIGWLEVSDGAGCGWTSHTDGDKANGTVRSIEACTEFPISHPRCARSFGPRPDVGSAAAAKSAARFTAEKQASMAAEEDARALVARSNLSGGARGSLAMPHEPKPARAARTPRTARQPRSASSPR